MSLEANDPRGVCNAMLDVALGPVTNLALQKLLYFAHGLYLMETGRPLVSGYFEAWQHGPVHPAAYAAFKRAGATPIAFRAVATDPLTGATTPIPPTASPEVKAIVMRVMVSFGTMSAGRLVEISHAKDAPWHAVVDRGRLGVSFGLRIPDSLIRERFNRHKVTVGPAPAYGEPVEDAPFVASDRPGEHCADSGQSSEAEEA